jgi:DNA-directed RNA polymerase specialized sigma24 family protein
MEPSGQPVKLQDAAKRVRDYTMPTDFCEVFNDHLDHLYTLSLLLTADHHKAEQCFVAALEDCLQGNSVFREWAQPWATRTVIKNAIRIISPSRRGTYTTTENYDFTEPTSEAGTPAAAITKLQPFDRFVYVMSVLERYSDRECSILLDCTVEEIADARTRALQRLVSVVSLEGREALDLATSA